MPVTYESIATTTLGSAQASVTFSSISSSFTDLVLVVAGAFSTTDNGFALTFNGDTTSNYSTTYLYGDGTSALSIRTTSATSINAGRFNTSFGIGITHIMNYANTTTSKTVLTRGNSGAIVNANVGLWRKSPAEAINSLTCTAPSANFTLGTTFTLYGIKAA
jgi:hypothetical protein